MKLTSFDWWRALNYRFHSVDVIAFSVLSHIYSFTNYTIMFISAVKKKACFHFILTLSFLLNFTIKPLQARTVAIALQNVLDRRRNILLALGFAVELLSNRILCSKQGFSVKSSIFRIENFK